MRYSEELLFICKEHNVYRNTVRWIYKDIKTGICYDIVRDFNSVNVSVVSESLHFSNDKFINFLCLLNEGCDDTYGLCYYAPFVTDSLYSRFYNCGGLDYRHAIDLINMFNLNKLSTERLNGNVVKELYKVANMLRVDD